MKYMTSKEQSEDETCACHMVFSQYYTIVGTFWAYILIFPRYLIRQRIWFIFLLQKNMIELNMKFECRCSIYSLWQETLFEVYRRYDLDCGDSGTSRQWQQQWSPPGW